MSVAMEKIPIAGLCLAAGLLLCRATAQIAYTDSPDSAAPRGVSADGQYALSQIESVDATTGNMSLSIPLAHLPPGPGGFSTGLNLIYNSNIYDVIAQSPSTPEQYNYETSTHGGGWNYSFHYTLWAQPRFNNMIQSGCSSIPLNEQQAWFKNYLRTPDGNNHVLTLISPSTAIRDTTNNDAYVEFDFGGNPNGTCTSLSPSSGTLVFATSDSTFIRVEANPAAGSWTAYFPDGTQVSGAIVSWNGYAQDSDAGAVKDRNGNTLIIYGSCQEGNPCIETLQETGLPASSQNIYVYYGSPSNGTWVDDVQWPAVNGGLHTYVSWETDSPDSSINYYNLVNPNGSTYTSFTENLSSNLTPYPSAVSSIQMPAPGFGGSAVQFTFGYSNWGEVHSLAMSAGGTQQYSAAYIYCYDVSPANPNCNTVTYPRPPAVAVNPIHSKTLTYTEKRDGTGSTQISETTSYAILGPSSAFTYPVVGVAGQVTYPDGTYSIIDTANPCPAGFNSRDYCPALPYSIQNRDGSVTLLGWASNTPPSFLQGMGAFFNPYVQFRTFTGASPANANSSATYTVEDVNGNTTTLNEYDWMPTGNVQRNTAGFVTGLAGSPTPVRTTAASFYQTGAYWGLTSASPYLRAKNQVTVGAAIAKYFYDNALTTANLTQLQQWDSAQPPSGGYISANWTYLSNGNVATTTDPRGTKTLLCYDTNPRDANYNLYPVTRVTGAAGGAACPSPTELPEGRTTTYATDLNSGLLTSETDVDNAITTTYLYDNLGRQTSATQSGGPLGRTTSTSYNDINPSATVTDGDGVTSTTYFDALGRVRYVVDGAGNKVQKAYRYGSNVSYGLESNPYTNLTDGTMGWTVTTRDSMGRPTQAQRFSGQTLPAPWGSNNTIRGTATTAYNQSVSGCSGPAIIATDEASAAHTYCPDGLGRQASAADGGGTNLYTYDALDNLIGVQAVGQTNNTCASGGIGQMRCFGYSSLSRLTSATNPESGTTNYVYDNNGNMTSRTDAVGNITTVSYDAINRPQGAGGAPAVVYSTTGSTQPTAGICYVWDLDFKGALRSVSTSPSNTSCATAVTSNSYTHDQLGRIESSQQFTLGQWYQFRYGYSLEDRLNYEKYPSGRQVKYTLDTAGRVTAVQNGTTLANYASGIGYVAAGGLSGLTLGNGVTHSWSWNDRFQAVGMTAKNASLTTLLGLGFYPCTGLATACATGNNGNLQAQTISGPGLSLTQSYTYDPGVNRLTGINENG
ncbi:MAG TPA: hypothetical protein VH639_13505, partial [Bryobacteraceae bacterium]